MAGFLQMVSASRNAGRGQHRGPATWQLCRAHEPAPRR